MEDKRLFARGDGMDLVRTETIRAKGFAGGYQKAVMPSGLTVLLYPTCLLYTSRCV